MAFHFPPAYLAPAGWGGNLNGWGESTVPAEAITDQVVQVAAGFYNTCTLSKLGKIFCACQMGGLALSLV